VDCCVLTRLKWIKCITQRFHLVKVGTNLTQVEVEGLEVVGFKINFGEGFNKTHKRFLALYKNVVQ
jgi:hypothetical protein